MIISSRIPLVAFVFLVSCKVSLAQPGFADVHIKSESLNLVLPKDLIGLAINLFGCANALQILALRFVSARLKWLFSTTNFRPSLALVWVAETGM
jgi:hypothetical protein